jgi:hypothetical protein
MDTERIDGQLVVIGTDSSDVAEPQKSKIVWSSSNGEFTVKFATSHQFRVEPPQDVWLKFTDAMGMIRFQQYEGHVGGITIPATVEWR